MNTKIYTKAMFGHHAIHIPANIIVQDMGDNKCVFVGQTTIADRLKFGGKLTHQLILGDLVLRPHMAFDSDAFVGVGLAGLAISGFCDPSAWIERGRILIENLPSRMRDMHR